MKVATIIFCLLLSGTYAQRGERGRGKSRSNGVGGGGGNDGGGPVPTLPPTESVSSIETAADILAIADARIRQTINQNRRIAATYLRLGFHDCVPNGPNGGGCDGCVNLSSNPENIGLLPAVEALAPIVADLENVALGISRADIWAYASLVAADASQSNLVFIDNFKTGRQNCETRGTCAITDPITCATNGPDQAFDFPSADLTTHELLDFFSEHFGFNADQTVAIMGAHTIGRALPQNSGFQGQAGWVNNPFVLDNAYYQQIVGGGQNNDENTALEVLANGPNWNSIEIDNAGSSFPNRFQWVRGPGGNGNRLIMLNADIAIVRDLVDDLQEDGDVNCSFRNPIQNRCPLADTLTKAGIYRSNDAAWVVDFKAALVIMLEKGL